MNEQRIKEQANMQNIVNTYVAAIITAGGSLRVTRAAMEQAVNKKVSIQATPDPETNDLILSVEIEEIPEPSRIILPNTATVPKGALLVAR